MYSFFSDMRRDVQEIFRNTPHEKQVCMFSATLSKEIRPVCKKFMQDVGLPKIIQGILSSQENSPKIGGDKASTKASLCSSSSSLANSSWGYDDLVGFQERSWRRIVEDEERRNGAGGCGR